MRRAQASLSIVRVILGTSSNVMTSGVIASINRAAHLRWVKDRKPVIFDCDLFGVPTRKGCPMQARLSSAFYSFEIRRSCRGFETMALVTRAQRPAQDRARIARWP